MDCARLRSFSHPSNSSLNKCVRCLLSENSWRIYENKWTVKHWWLTIICLSVNIHSNFFKSAMIAKKWGCLCLKIAIVTDILLLWNYISMVYAYLLFKFNLNNWNSNNNNNNSLCIFNLGIFHIYSVRRSIYKTLAEAVRESEIANADPANVIVHATRQRWHYCLKFREYKWFLIFYQSVWKIFEL